MEFNKRKTKIFLITGKARSGKDTVAKLIRDYYKDLDVINDLFAYYIKDYAKRITGWDGSEETKPREFLQQFGTGLVRNKIDEHFFTNRMIEDLKIFNYFYDVVTISDGRLISEIEMIRENFDNVFVIRVNRPNFDNGLTDEQKNHPTEIALDNYTKYDYVVENDGSAEELETKVREMVEKNEY